jgi:DNA-binding response OmpR family regulator
VTENQRSGWKGRVNAMSSVVENLQSREKSPEVVTLLLVTAYGDDFPSLSGLLDRRDWAIASCRGCTEAAEQLKRLAPAVVMCERDLPDGNWKRVFSEMQSLERAPLMLVTSRHADESLWAEVLSLGGYDVLQKPFDPAEVSRVLSMARRSWSTQLHDRTADSSSRYSESLH